MTAASVRVALADRSYDIHIASGLLDRAGELVRPVLRGRDVVVVTDRNLAGTSHPQRLAAALARADIRSRLVILPAGEATKSLTQLGWLLDDLLAHGAERRLTLMALGGGVIGDLVGFAAAVLLRGVDFIQLPTTLLAQVDSAVGGKTGINSRHGKNLIGAFHQPRLVLIDTDVLGDLPQRELKAGYAEIVKYAFIRDRHFFDWLESFSAAVIEGDAAARQQAIRRSLEIKAEIVAADERETSGQRALLNLGHTFAHAYEALAGYGSELLHGEAVSFGMMQAFALAERMGRCPATDCARASRHLASLGLPVSPRDVTGRPFDGDALLAAMGRDKKVENAKLRFVLPLGIGHAAIADDVPAELVRAVLHDAHG